MLNHPLLTLLLTSVLGVLAAVLGWLINQLPAIPQFPGQKALILKLTFELVVLGVVFSWLKDFSKDSEDWIKVSARTVGCMVLLLFVWHTSQLLWKLWQTKQYSNGSTQTLNTTTGLKTPDDWRRELLKAMKIEVTKRLRDSLHNEEIIQLQMENRQEQIGRSQLLAIKNNQSSPLGWLQPQRLLKVFGGLDSELEAGKSIIEVFDQPDIAGRLLILGAPGVGKTTMLLEVVRDLIERAEQQPDYPIPVLFELSNWQDDKQAISNWLTAELKFRYNVPDAISCHWLNIGKLLPLLDGLDELGLPRQQKCIKQINNFLQNNSSLLPLVVCCREEEYIKGEAILRQMRGAVCLQPLSPNQIQSYLHCLGYFHLWQAIKDDPDGLGELAKIPLFLHLIPVAYPEGLVKKGKRFNSIDERQAYQEKCRRELFDTYIKRCLKEPHDRKGYNFEDTKQWLRWLAKTMNQQNKKEFYIEKMQPNWLENSTHKKLFQLITGLIMGLIIGLIPSTGYWLIYKQPESRFVVTLISFVIFSLLGCLIARPNENIKLVEVVKIAWKYILSFTIHLTKSMLIVYLVFLLLLEINKLIKLVNIFFDWSWKDIYSSLFSFLSTALIFAPINGLRSIDIERRTIPNQGIWYSATNSGFLTLIVWLIYVLSYILLQGLSKELFAKVIQGLQFGLSIGLLSGGLACIQHFSLRLILWQNKLIPWNYSHFLSYAAERGLIQQVGGRYRFIHDLLQEHFAEM
jgi:DNA polymerase III delta prime subunit